MLGVYSVFGIATVKLEGLINVNWLQKYNLRPPMVDPDKFSCSLLRSSYQNTQKHAITGSEDEVDIFVKIDMLTLIGWSEKNPAQD